MKTISIAAAHEIGKIERQRLTIGRMEVQVCGSNSHVL
jgi:hypothetical protein